MFIVVDVVRVNERIMYARLVIGNIYYCYLGCNHC